MRWLQTIFISQSLRLLMYFHRYFNVRTPSLWTCFHWSCGKPIWWRPAANIFNFWCAGITKGKFTQSFVKNMSYNKNSHPSISGKLMETWLWTENVSIFMYWDYTQRFMNVSFIVSPWPFWCHFFFVLHGSSTNVCGLPTGQCSTLSTDVVSY